MALKLPHARWGITRMDHGRSTHGWNFRFAYKGENYRQFFADKKNGGKIAALEKAKACRDATFRQLKVTQDEVTGWARHRRPHPGNPQSGMICVNWLNPSGKRTFCSWAASWRNKDTNHRKIQMFSVERYGHEKALDLAKRARRKALREGHL